MTHYLVQLRDWIFVKGCGFLSFAKKMGKTIGKNISKSLSSKYSQKLLVHTKQSATDVLETASKRAIQKPSEATDDLKGNKIAHKITRASKTSPKNDSATSEEVILWEKYTSPELRQKIIDDLRLKKENYWILGYRFTWWYKINNIILM